jgi:hypothetical protein
VYIAFDLPQGAGGSTAAWTNHILHQELYTWKEKYGINLQIKTVKYVTRVILEPDEMYSFFAVTWNPINSKLRNYRMIEPMSLDNH